LQQEAAQDCQNCSQMQIQASVTEHQKNLLRDMIDQQLLIERAKDMDVSVETDLIKRLDDVRKQNNLSSLEDLEKAVEQQGIVWEDYKTQLRNSLLTQEVIRREVGGRMNIGSDEVKAYYEAHKQEFNRPEQVSLAELFLSTDGKSPEEISAVRTRADDLHNRLVKGEDFDQLVKRYSEGSTAQQQNGDLGEFERGQLSKQLEDAVFTMEKNQFTDVIQTKTGFEILKVLDHFQAGLQPLDKVDGEITNILYRQKMDPAMRVYLAQLREESYVLVKPGYTDSAAVAGATVIQEVAPTPDAADKKKEKKKLPLPKATS
jgi:peptidyl-prolyl cis-trans isomerase SurA